MRIIRILLYEGSPEKLDVQLGSSMPVGTRRMGNGLTITVRQFGGFWQFIWLLLTGGGKERADG